MITFDHISKRFGGVRALDDVSFSVAPGTIHAIVGENGAGKSTLMKIAAGVHPPDGGVVLLDDKPVALSSPRRARDVGIALVPQEPALCPNLTVSDNLNLGDEPRRFGLLRPAAARARAQQALERAALDIDPDTPVELLSSAQRHLLQIARALAQQARILILDEPTAALSEGEAGTLFSRLRALRAEGVTILYISHRLPEIFELCDAITTLRDGRLVDTQKITDVDPAAIVQRMVGRALLEEEAATEEKIAAVVPPSTEPLLKVEGLQRRGVFDAVSFEVRPGEIVGMAGLVGSGRSEIARCVFGLDRPSSGRMWLGGQAFAPRHPRAAIRQGVALVPEDRRGQGLVMQLSVRHNLALPSLAAKLQNLATLGLVRRGRESAAVRASIDSLAIKTASPEAGVDTLSGGNQQKVVIGKWLTLGPRLFIVDEPTQGVDVGAKAQVHRLLADLARQGFGVLMISSDLPEVLSLSHRILVMRQGQLVGVLAHGATAEDVMHLAAIGEVAAAA